MHTPQQWRLRGPRLRLEGSICQICGRPSFPPRPVCAQCRPARQEGAAYNGVHIPWASHSGISVSLTRSDVFFPIHHATISPDREGYPQFLAIANTHSA
jgi:hypothetical protein